MKVGLTGSSGVLGSFLAPLIAEQKAISLLRLSVRKSGGLTEGWTADSNKVEMLCGNLLDSRHCNDFFEGLDAVVHCANVGVPLGSDHLAADILATNSLMTANMLHAAMRGGKRPHFVFASSAGAVYKKSMNGDPRPFTEENPCEPTSFYGVSKLQSEQSLRLAAERNWLDATILRITNIFGARVSEDRGQGLVDVAVSRVLGAKAVTVHGSLGNVRDYVHISDVSRAIVSILVRPDRLIGTFNVSTGIGYSVQEVLDTIRRVSGRPIELNVPDETGSNPELPLYAVACAEKIFRTLGWHARISLEEGVKALLENDPRRLAKH
jgi:UDP-glucose 4-epimerase